ncbi:MAG: DUF1887 family protein [Lachnospiraceae bacterium oral taxon 082]|nr:DUF1887 family protein [Lachnospiraceae bacterium oral taxon 082]
MLKLASVYKVEDDEDKPLEAVPLTEDKTKKYEIQVSDRVGTINLLERMENVIMYSTGIQDYVPPKVRKLAVEIMKNHDLIRDILGEIRQKYQRQDKDFEISLNDVEEYKKYQILELFRKMSGIISGVRYNRENNTIKCSLTMTQKAQRFITGQYLEIAVEDVVNDILSEWAGSKGIPYKVYRNVKIESLNGTVKNEFDIVIVIRNKFYIVECKSGKNFDDWNRLSEIAVDYGILPQRMCLVYSYATEEDIQSIEYFCEYYICDTSSLRNKIIQMISFG